MRGSARARQYACGGATHPTECALRHSQAVRSRREMHIKLFLKMPWLQARLRLRFLLPRSPGFQQPPSSDVSAPEISTTESCASDSDIAEMHRNKGDSEAANSHISRALEIDPDHPAGMLWTGERQRVSGENAEAEESFTRRPKKRGNACGGSNLPNKGSPTRSVSRRFTSSPICSLARAGSTMRP